MRTVFGFLMKRVAAWAILCILASSCCLQAFAKTGNPSRAQNPDYRKAQKKQQKAQKKYVKAQRKAERKMLKTERKNTRYPSRQF
jgi:hypothetical protein